MDYSSAADVGSSYYLVSCPFTNPFFQSQLVPWAKEIEEIDLWQVKWILVIEKEVVHIYLWDYNVSDCV